MASTTNTHKNNYGKKKRKSKVSKRLRRDIETVLDEKDAKEVELKYIDTDHTTPQNITNAGIINHLSACAEGTGYDERVGLKIKGKSLQIRFELIHSDSTNMIRVIVLRWFCSSTPTVADIIHAPAASTPWPLNPLNINNSKEIQILYDNLFALSTYTNANQVDKFYINKPMNISFETDDTRDNGHLYLLAISDSVASTHPTIGYWSRVRFTDM